MRCLVIILLMIISLQSKTIHTGSKKFTESVILGEIATHIAQACGHKAEHKSELGGTRVLWNALLSGDIDIYPEYSGTLLNEILAERNFTSFKQVLKYLDSLDIEAVGPLGFNNTYALGVMQKISQKYQLESISDLINYPELRFGFTNEFMDREDGWPALQSAYNLPQKDIRGLDHDLAYKALESNSIDVMDLYSTDAEIKYYNLVVLKDDLKHFPEYQAYFLVRKEIANDYPDVYRYLNLLKNKINEDKMSRMNAAVKIQKESSALVAAAFVEDELKLEVNNETASFIDRLYKNTVDHLILVLISLTAAIFVSIPLGILAVKKRKAGQIILGVAGIIQTIPSLAILVFMIPLLGIGAYPAMTALFLYSLLPIIRNTYSGITDIPRPLSESAIALGLTGWERLRFVELPLAGRSIMAGIKTAAVINVGTATLGALIGAGGYGQPILTGIRLDDTVLILEGAVPAAVLALLVQGAFDLIEKHMVKH